MLPSFDKVQHGLQRQFTACGLYDPGGGNLSDNKASGRRATGGNARARTQWSSKFHAPDELHLVKGGCMLKKKRRRSREFKSNKQVIDIEEARQKRKRKRQHAAVKKYKPKNIVTQRQAGKKARRRMVYFFIFFAVLCIIGASVFNIISLRMTEAKALKEHEALLKQKAKLERIYSQVSSPEYIEQQARQQLKMIKPGEILYVLPKPDKKTTDGGIVPK